jgi:hypothetical protein
MKIESKATSKVMKVGWNRPKLIRNTGTEVVETYLVFVYLGWSIEGCTTDVAEAEKSAKQIETSSKIFFHMCSQALPHFHIYVNGLFAA